MFHLYLDIFCSHPHDGKNINKLQITENTNTKVFGKPLIKKLLYLTSDRAVELVGLYGISKPT